MPASVSWNEQPQMRWLWAMEMGSWRVLEPGKPSQGVSRALLPLQVPGKECSLSLLPQVVGGSARRPLVAASF